jgi:exosome complex component RRP42
MADSYKAMVSELLEKGMRRDGRGVWDYRQISVDINPIPRANGSARVRMGKTEVIVGVKFDVGTPFPDTPEEGILIVNAEFNPMAHPDFESGPPRPPAIELARVVDRGIRESHLVKVDKLVIKPKEKVWTVFVDIYPINHDGNLFDAAALGAVVALKNAVMPKYDETEEKVMHKELTKKKLELNEIPVLTTFGKVGNYVFSDFDIKEEEALDARLSVSTLPNGDMCAMQKGGAGTFTQEEVELLFEKAAEKAKELRKLIK